MNAAGAWRCGSVFMALSWDLYQVPTVFRTFPLEAWCQENQDLLERPTSKERFMVSLKPIFRPLEKNHVKLCQLI